MNIILLGPPGAGKGTLAERLIADRGFVHISTGQILREAVASKTKVGLEAKTFMDKGELVPDEVVARLVMEKLKESDVRSKGFILDGFPRNLEQARLLDKSLKEATIKVDHVVCLDATEEVIIRRLSGRRICRKCGKNFNIFTMKPRKEGVCDACSGELYQRDDDREETVRNRLVVYNRQTEPLIDFYKKQGLLKTFDGGRPIDETYGQIASVL
jgi:adenylate kinase